MVPLRSSGPILVLALAVACEGNPVGSPDDVLIFPEIPERVTGEYDTSHRFTVATAAITATCQGFMTIDTQAQTVFIGSNRIHAGGNCREAHGAVSGSIRGSTVTFELGLPNPLVGTSCTLLGGAPAFLGNLTGRRISGTRPMSGRCTIDGQTQDVMISWEFDANRRVRR